MTISLLKKFMTRLRDDTSGTIVIETVITLPLLIWALMATFEFFEVFRYQSIRDKATYVIADMISREALVPGFVDNTYIDNSLTLFNDVVNDNGVNQLRITIIKFTPGNGYTVEWSKIRGTGGMQELTTAVLQTDLAHIPVLSVGEELILVDSTSNYVSTFNVGLGANIPVASRTFTSFREIAQLCFGPSSC